MNESPDRPDDEPEPAAPEDSGAAGAATPPGAPESWPPPRGGTPPPGGATPPPPYAGPPPQAYAGPPPPGYGGPTSPPDWGAAPPPGTPSMQSRFPVWAGLLVGVGAFVLSMIAAIAVLLAAYNTGSSTGPLIGFAVTMLLVPIAAVVMLFFKRARPGAAGILIIFAAGWILLVGPCIAPLFTSYQAIGG
ncbi:hypothetical protein ABZ477_16785 [Microbacterium sp. NPDC019599]|uniref:hypothetical protein n=1 Tax=Microbacterium sp. NPDC019599 TaxID=3154690 RepID=UPI0033DFAF16